MKKLFSVIITALLIISVVPLGAFAAAGDKTFYVGDAVVTVDAAAKTLTVSGTGALPDYSSAGGAPWYANAYAECVIIEDGITAIGNRCFSNNQKIKKVVIGDTVERIGVSAFSTSKNITEVSFPSSLKRIEDFAFYSTAVASVSLPDGVEYIGQSVFSSCASLKKVEIPESLKYFDASALTGTAYYKALPNGVNLISGFTLAPKGTLPADLTIPEGTRVISANMVTSSTKLASVTIPDGVEEILDFAFYNDTLMTFVTLPDSVKYIGPFALGYTSDKTYLTPVAQQGFTVYGHGGAESERYAALGGLDFVCLCEEGGYASAPDCLTGGEADVVCRFCGRVMRTESVAPRGAHSFADEITTPATCTEDGVTSHVCRDCGYVEYTSVVKAAGHTPDMSAPVIVDPTCTESGEIYFECTACGAHCDSFVMLPTGHTPGDETVLRSPTCTEDGVSATLCALCGETISTSPIPATGHVTGIIWDVLIKSDLATLKKGFRVLKCEVCGVAVKHGYFLAGDVNGDGKINLNDLADMKKCLANMDDESLIVESCDVNGDGAINLADLADFKKILAS